MRSGYATCKNVRAVNSQTPWFTMNVLLLNLTRFGDLLQTQATITDFVSHGHTVALVCQENFAPAAALLKGVSRVFPFHGARILEALADEHKAAPGEAFRCWTGALAELGAWRGALYSAFPPDTAVNLTPTQSARLLCLYLAGGVPCRGFSLDGHGFGVSGNGWAAFLQTASQERGVSPFNVVDVFRKAAESGAQGRLGDNSLCPPDEAARRKIAALLDREAPKGHKGFVGLQLGASENRRRWPVGSFVELGNRLWSEGYCPVLFGSQGEKELAERYVRSAEGKCVNLIGSTGIGELAAGLSWTRLLVTNDTGTMHLAAGLGVPVLAVFLATAQPFDTGPYRVGACSVEPDMDCHPCAFGSVCDREEACRHAVRPETMARLALARLATGAWSRLAGTGARIWEAEDDGSGFLALRSLSGHEGASRSLWLALQRRYIGAYLDRPADSPFTPPAPGGEAQLLPALWRSESAATARAAADLSLLFLQQGRVLALARKGGMGERLLATWERVCALFAAQPGFAALAMLWIQETQAQDRDLPAVLASVEAFQAMTDALALELS